MPTQVTLTTQGTLNRDRLNLSRILPGGWKGLVTITGARTAQRDLQLTAGQSVLDVVREWLVGGENLPTDEVDDLIRGLEEEARRVHVWLSFELSPDDSPHRSVVRDTRPSQPPPAG